ncbi:hypothetical protein V500_03941, partial [Pseudogymnoascus sp. VKM F-4518 (FW-2643)]
MFGNVIHKRVAYTSKSPTKTPKCVNLTKVNMLLPTQAQSSNQEGRILLAINAIKQGQFQSVRAAAALYNIPRTTLRNWIHRMASQRDSIP